MKTTWAILKWLLIAWGAICLAGALAIAYRVGPGNVDASNAATKADVRFVLNWCQLGDERIEEVLHSYKSARSLTGDHLDAYAIRVSHVDAAELTRDDFGLGWHRCDQLNGVLKDACDFAVGWLNSDEIAWFPRDNELASEGMFVYPWSIYCHGTRPAAVELIFVRPKDKMVFYLSVKT